MRVERDQIGEVRLPDDAYYGIQSYRASKNFSISGTQVHISFLRGYLLLKRAAAVANFKAGVLDEVLSEAITHVIDRLLGNFERRHFIVDAYQAGAGTSQNMNVNEVIANLANELLSKPLGSYFPVHPNDQVNASQSTNDTYPTVLRLVALQLSKKLGLELDLLRKSFEQKAIEFDEVLKGGRTHLQDALPIRLGQEFASYAHTLRSLHNYLEEAQEQLRVLGIGGSAVGTGMNVPKNYPDEILKELKTQFQDSKLKLSKNLGAEMQSQLPVLIYSNVLRSIAIELTRIFNDLRLLASGPTNGIAEISLPEVQAGSSMMPGKVNPSLLEMGNQVCFKVMGNDTALGFASQAGQLELNVMMPLMAQLVLESSELLTNAILTIRLNCIDGIKANLENCQKYAENTSQVVTALSPILGYQKSAQIVKEAILAKQSVFQWVRSKKILTDEQNKVLLAPHRMTEPGFLEQK